MNTAYIHNILDSHANGYRFYTNANSTTPGAARGAANTQLISIKTKRSSNIPPAPSSERPMNAGFVNMSIYKLQYATKTQALALLLLAGVT